jgi:hypothetical protein
VQAPTCCCTVSAALLRCYSIDAAAAQLSAQSLRCVRARVLESVGPC